MLNLAITEKEKKIKQKLHECLPNVNIDCSRLADNKGVNYVHYFVMPINKNLENSEYYYREELKFIHFTNLNALQSIIANGNLRLYNLRNLNDPNEYYYTGKLFPFSPEHLDDARDNFFLLSMCNESIVLNNSSIDSEFNMWRLYGNDGYGVGLQLSFENSNPLNWQDVFLSKVHYSFEPKTNLPELKEYIDQCANEVPEITIDIGQLACFHKSNLFKLEEEVRLLFDQRKYRNISSTEHYFNSQLIYPIIETDISKSAFDPKIKFFELPIYSAKVAPPAFLNKVPIPRISKIILGYRYDENFETIATLIKDLVFKKLGYDIEIERSRLTDMYNRRTPGR